MISVAKKRKSEVYIVVVGIFNKIMRRRIMHRIYTIDMKCVIIFLFSYIVDLLLNIRWSLSFDYYNVDFLNTHG